MRGLTYLTSLYHSTLQDTIIRWRAAQALVQLRRDLREEAALVMREVARCIDAPHHVRWRSARVLARWSATCRDEAREILGTLRSAQR